MRAVDTLVAGLSDVNVLFVRRAAEDGLGTICGAHGRARLMAEVGSGYDSLERAMRSRDPIVRLAAMQMLQRSEPIEVLQLALRDELPIIRRSAASKLHDLRDRYAAEVAMAAINDVDDETRRLALQAVAAHPSHAAVEPLIALLAHPNHETRQAACEILGGLGAERAIRPLIARLKDPVPAVQIASSEALGKFADSRAAPALRELAKSTEQYVRNSAIWALEEVEKRN